MHSVCHIYLEVHDRDRKWLKASLCIFTLESKPLVLTWEVPGPNTRRSQY